MRLLDKYRNYYKRIDGFIAVSANPDFLAMCFGRALITTILYFGLVIALNNKGIIPEYDGLSYLTNVLILKEYIFDFAPFKLIQTSSGLLMAPIPFTNALDVIVSAALWPILDSHVSVYLVHACYVIYFYYIYRLVHGEVYALMLISTCVGYGLFFPQFSNLISELPVGLGFVAIVSLLFIEDPVSNRRHIFVAGCLMIFLRVFNIAFIFAFAFLYYVTTYKKLGFSNQLAVLVPLLSPVFIYLALLPQNVMGFFEYAVTGNENLHVWIAMSGIHNKYELAVYYLYNMYTYYSRVFLITLTFFSFVSIYFLVVNRKIIAIKSANWPGFVASVALMCVAFMQPAVSNVNIVYWPYVIFGLMGVVLFRVINTRLSASLAILFSLYAMSVLWHGFQNQLIKTKTSRGISELSHAIAGNIKQLQNPVLFSNFHGVGALDPHGLQLALGKTFGSAMRNNLVGRVDPVNDAELRGLLEQSNILVLAHSNYFWPKYIEWNKFVSNLYYSTVRLAPALGYQYLTTHNYDDNPELAFDVWVKPEVKILSNNTDGWLSEVTGVKVTSPSHDKLNEFKIIFELMVHNPGQEAFAMPINFNLIDHNEDIVSSGALMDFGKVSLCMNISSDAGNYQLKADKSFSTPADARKLVAQLISSKISKGNCDGKSS